MFKSIAIVLVLAGVTSLSSVSACDVIGSEEKTETARRSRDKEAQRAKAQAYFNQLVKVQNADEEKALLTEFAAWLRANEYRIEVEEKKGKHWLACPYFPPVTPYTIHSFFDVKNLELLPRLAQDVD